MSSAMTLPTLDGNLATAPSPPPADVASIAIADFSPSSANTVTNPPPVSAPMVLANGRTVSSNDEDSTSYTIYVGGRAFIVSWASLNSDAPNNFTVNWKSCPSHTIHLDRDPDNFEIILQYLRGYHVWPKDAVQNENLVADAEYYGFKRLKNILRQMVFINVGGTVFRLSTDLVEKDSPNFFTVTLKHLFDPHIEVGEASVLYLDRDPEQFAQIVRHLQGYTITIRDETHRLNLLKDAQYYALRGLRDRLLSSRTVLDGLGDAQGSRPEVLLWLSDVRILNLVKPDLMLKPDVSVAQEAHLNGDTIHLSEAFPPESQVNYKRDNRVNALLVQLISSRFRCHYPLAQPSASPPPKPTYTIEPLDVDVRKLREIARAVGASDLDTTVHIEESAAIEIDGEQVSTAELAAVGEMAAAKRTENEPSVSGVMKRLVELAKEEDGEGTGWKLGLYLTRGMIGMHIVAEKLTFSLVRFEAISGRVQLNRKREFLPVLPVLG